LTLHFS